MADLDKAIQDPRMDARKLWLPVSVIVTILLAVLGSAVGVGWWLNDVQDTAAGQVVTANRLQAVSDQLSQMQGSINALMSMQQAISDTRAEVGALNARLDAYETRMQSMDVWIQTTRERLNKQGLESPPYRAMAQ